MAVGGSQWHTVAVGGSRWHTMAYGKRLFLDRKPAEGDFRRHPSESYRKICKTVRVGYFIDFLYLQKLTDRKTVL